MKITLVSDLHLEFSDVRLPNTQGADVLILGGDIMIAQSLHDFKANDAVLPSTFTERGRAERFREFLKHVSEEYKHVIYVAGNHEFYHGKYPDAYDYLEEECRAFNNIYFLEQSSVEIDGITFIGATLWTDMNKGDRATLHLVKDTMNDYRVIRNSARNYSRLTPIDTVIRHNKTINYIRSIVESDPKKTYVVVGHHAPSKISVKPRYAKDVQLNGAYSSDLSELINSLPQIKLWTHGHTHDCFDYMIGETRIVCNPRGYEGYEDPSGWDPTMVITV
jgi:Icc-related predicted phosphoesterase